MFSNASDLVPKPPPYVVVFGPHANCTLDICPVELSVYGYRPSLAANTTFIALYGLSAVIHTYLGIRWKQWWFMGCMLLAAASAIIGYIGRVMMYYNPFNFSAFMLQISQFLATSPPYLPNSGTRTNTRDRTTAQSASPPCQSTTAPPSTSPSRSRESWRSPDLPPFPQRFTTHAKR
ncbi:uncharacterized protein THITE_2117392 [Thermothielavioides terrestris NRRL 8126]|uniref:Uncharacterized protein n=1 Tax=Thermothielavioides terrestris (strain ATCC 38088 / NRRL 8126) TaxID=578455 RepID=G2R804_THETT|nr:uncharacterized protein THITE_2117392 [Thermothielavioides terrestris NRRL 8126]AEO68063.1 hypothetical protein THITE_2117392 [Thermothielavioides terrestris NRRL 8126]